MTRRSTIWMGVAVVFCLVNLAGAVMAALAGERRHAATHAVLALVGAYYARRIWARRTPTLPVLAVPGELDNRLTHLELSIEDVALQVERVGEGQRFITHFLADHGTAPTPREAAAEPVAIEADGNTPPPRHGV